MPININNFKKSLEFTLKWEGGYVCDSNDPGGETKWGISKRSYPDLDIRNLTPEKAAELYANDYWLPSGADGQQFPFCTAIFDTAVNCGVGRAASWLKSSPDVRSFIACRVDYYAGLAKKNPALQKFMRGWLNRVNDLKKFCEINADPDSPTQAVQ